MYKRYQDHPELDDGDWEKDGAASVGEIMGEVECSIIGTSDQLQCHFFITIVCQNPINTSTLGPLRRLILPSLLEFVTLLLRLVNGLLGVLGGGVDGEEAERGGAGINDYDRAQRAWRARPSGSDSER
jgi:hypothetical protein